MTDITIPLAALEAGARAIAQTTEPKDKWRYHIPEARAAFLAMIEEWEGMRHDGPSGGGISQEPLQLSRIILPLTEKPND